MAKYYYIQINESGDIISMLDTHKEISDENMIEVTKAVFDDKPLRGKYNKLDSTLTHAPATRVVSNNELYDRLTIVEKGLLFGSSLTSAVRFLFELRVRDIFDLSSDNVTSLLDGLQTDGLLTSQRIAEILS